VLPQKAGAIPHLALSVQSPSAIFQAAGDNHRGHGIYTPGVDDEICPTISMQTEIDWLIYNKPLTYARLVFSGELEQYARDMAGTHGLKD